MKLPEHKIALFLSHNDHKTVYEKVDDWVSNNGWCDWESEQAQQRAIATDEVWTLQWYPDSTVGFYGIAAPTLAELLAYAESIERRVTLPDSA